MALFTANWTPLGKNVYYRKVELYTMEWADQVNLADFVVAAAQFGGPIALTRDEKKLQKVYGPTSSNITIFSSSGQVISSITWKSGRLVHMAWSCSEDLLCILEDGHVLSYDMHGSLQGTTTMGQEAKDTKVLECRVFSNQKSCTGVAVLTGAYHIFVVNNIKEPRIRKLPNVPGLDAPPTCWDVVTEERTTKVLLAVDSQMYLLDQNSDKCVPLSVKFNNPINAITEIAVSCNHQQVALFSDSGVLWLGSSDLEQKYCEFYTQSKMRPQQLVWCGNGAVAGIWQNNLLVVGLENDWFHHYYYTTIVLVPEIDGVRIIGNVTHELLQKVPSSVVDVFRIGSVSPSALLLEASKEFQLKSHKADDYMRMIREKDELEIAISCCIQAAGHEFQPSTQKMLLRAASFGKCFVPSMDPEPHVQMCKTLRVLNAVRVNSIGLPLTYTQLEYLTVPVLLDRLVLRRHYPLAIKICQYWKISDTEGTSRILTRWACYKVKRTSLDPELTARIIAEKLDYTPGISYSEISNKAKEYGHTKLSVKLLDYETRASEQVPLLITLQHETQAMNKAIESGDTDLIYLVIFHLLNSLTKGDFHMKIRNFPIAYALYLKLCKEKDIELLRENYYQESDFNGDAECHVMESYSSSRMENRVSSLLAALDSYKKAKNDFASQVTEEQVRLLKYQSMLEEKFKQSFMDQSLQETMKQLLETREYKLAEELRKEFKVPDRRFWWLKITILADGGDWLELEKFSKSKKSPVGYEPFVDVCVKHNNTYEAKKYLPKVKDENRIKYCIKTGMLEDAAKAAYEQKDIPALNQIQNLCGIMDRTLSERINTMKLQLGPKR